MGRRKKSKSLLFVICVIVIIYGVFFIASRYYPDLFSSKNSSNGGNNQNPSLFDNFSNTQEGSLNIYFLDVGQGDCIIIEFPDNKTMIIDSGDNKTDCEKKIKEFTDALSIERFDYMLLTHADADHVGSMDYVFQNYEIGKVFRPNVLSTHANATSLNEGINVGFSSSNGGDVKSSKAYYDFLYYMQEEKCESEIFNKDSDFSGSYVSGNQTLEYVFDFLTPVAEKSLIKYKDANDYSPIVALKYNGVTVLLTGDAETQAEKEFMDYYKGVYPDCDLLKVGHHGSETSTSSNFLNAVKPEFAIIQCGIDNKYNHPRQAVLDRLKGINSAVYRTDKNGDVVFTVSCESNYKIDSSKIFCKNINVSDNFVGQDV